MTRILLALLLVGCSDGAPPRESAPGTYGICPARACPDGMVVTYEQYRYPCCLCVPGALPKEK